MAAAEVSLPGVGPVSRRALLLGGGAAVLVMGVLWWRRRTTGAAVVPLDDPEAVDGTAGGGGGAGPDLPVSSLPTSNPQWTALVMQQLGSVVDPSALSEALGRYLTGGSISTAQEALIDQAIAVAGYPPVAGPNGYPPGIRTQPPAGQTPPPAPPPTPTTPAPAAVSHVVVRGDTLERIARSWGTTAGAVYAHNATVIEAAARRYGHSTSNHGWWIFPGTRLYKP